MAIPRRMSTHLVHAGPYIEGKEKSRITAYPGEFLTGESWRQINRWSYPLKCPRTGDSGVDQVLTN